MAKVNLVIPDDVLNDLRHAVIEKYSGLKGGLSLAVTEAIKLWLKSESSRRKEK